MSDNPQHRRALVVGVGGLGGPLSFALAAFVDELILCDPDVVELSNLHRQVQFREDDIGHDKVRVMQKRLFGRDRRRLAVTAVKVAIGDHNIADYAANVDLIVDGSDSYAAKFAVNDYAVAHGVPFVIASLARFTGFVFSRNNSGPCYRCLFEAPPAQQISCDAVGVLGASCSIIAAHGARAAQDVLTQQRPARLQSFPDLTTPNNIRVVDFARRPDCPACSHVSQQGEKDMATVKIPTPLRKFTGGQESVNASGATIGELIGDLESNFPGLKSSICDDAGKVKRYVNIYANEEDIRHLQNLETPVGEGDEISIVPAIAGG